MTACELVREATEALMRCEAAHLSELADRAPEVEIPGSERDLSEFRISRRVLERLLALTRRNLTILQGIRGGPMPYGVGQS